MGAEEEVTHSDTLIPKSGLSKGLERAGEHEENDEQHVDQLDAENKKVDDDSISAKYDIIDKYTLFYRRARKDGEEEQVSKRKEVTSHDNEDDKANETEIVNDKDASSVNSDTTSVNYGEHNVEGDKKDGHQSENVKTNLQQPESETQKDKLEHAKETEITKPTNDIARLDAFTNGYVCPFSKLIETKSTSGFFQFGTGNKELEKTDDVSTTDETQAATDTIAKSWDVQTTIGDDEKLLYENKKCSLAHYDGTEWTTPIPVVLQLIAKKNGNSKRFVCYQVGTGRLQLNTTILATMSVTKLKTRSLIFVGQLIADEKKLAPHRIIFQDQTQRDACHAHF
ncbi:immunodominant interspersed repeat antigen, putative [Babesia ovis]|uniref:Immunodominant interspersed repeat antigen, putative n=1 Tax=Babesia ovis TaxID=5869 RepID=A0A9W5TEC5_BABOV|nr:immunodominant interspersed repeat antigen, putative [Babesia ovis]